MKKTETKKIDDKRYVHCPVCGGLLAKSKNGTASQQSCHRCSWSLEYKLQADENGGFLLIIKAWKIEQEKIIAN